MNKFIRFADDILNTENISAVRKLNQQQPPDLKDEIAQGKPTPPQTHFMIVVILKEMLQLKDDEGNITTRPNTAMYRYMNEEDRDREYDNAFAILVMNVNPVKIYPVRKPN